MQRIYEETTSRAILFRYELERTMKLGELMLVFLVPATHRLLSAAAAPPLYAVSLAPPSSVSPSLWATPAVVETKNKSQSVINTRILGKQREGHWMQNRKICFSFEISAQMGLL